MIIPGDSEPADEARLGELRRERSGQVLRGAAASIGSTVCGGANVYIGFFEPEAPTVLTLGTLAGAVGCGMVARRFFGEANATYNEIYRIENPPPPIDTEAWRLVQQPPPPLGEPDRSMPPPFTEGLE